jgi:hypothetical protein
MGFNSGLKGLMKRLTHDTAYLAITYQKRVQNYVGTSDGSISYIHLPDGLGISNELSSFGKKKASSHRQLDPKNTVKPKAICRTEAVNKF